MQVFRGIRAVFFDLDGTLVDSTELILSSHEHTQRYHFNRTMDRRTLVRDMGRSLAETMHDYAVEFGCVDPAAAAAEMLATYRHYQRFAEERLMRPFPSVNEVLSILRGQGIATGVVTSKVAAVARPALARYGLAPLLDVGIFHDDTAEHKPHPAPLLEAAGRAKVRPDRAVYVGDSTHDLVAGRAAGMKTIAALWGPYERADLEEAGADWYADAPLDVLRAVGCEGVGRVGFGPDEGPGACDGAAAVEGAAAEKGGVAAPDGPQGAGAP
ncbi:MAG: HAD family hydrolase [Vicinamibacterales bacterium]